MDRNVEVKTYRAGSMHEALALVRRELGPEAAILHTREVQSRRLFGLLTGPRQIEVTASSEVNVASRLPSRLRGAAASGTQAIRLAPAPSYAGEASSTVGGHPLSGHGFGRPLAAPPSQAGLSLTEPAATLPQPADAAASHVHGQLNDLHSMVKELCRRSQGHSSRELPEELFRLFAELLDADLGEELARELVERIRADVPAAEMSDARMLRARIARMVESDIRAAGPIAVTPGRCRLAALVGPTGVGKTTTIAKLAAIYRLKEKRRVGLITVDTYRIAAVEQLRTYADIIDLPMQVVSTPREMRDAVRRMDDLDLVLLDTAGRSPKDEVKIQELKAFLSEAGADEVHLVLSSVASQRTLQHTAKQFAAVGTTSLILTKLDEAPGMGQVLPLLRECRLPVSYMTNGQNVPDDIEVADSARLGRLILGVDFPRS